MAVRPVATTLEAGDVRVHLFQVVRERRNGGHEDWIVVGMDAGAVELASVGFDWSRTVPSAAIADGGLEPLVEGGVPVWGY